MVKNLGMLEDGIAAPGVGGTARVSPPQPPASGVTIVLSVAGYKGRGQKKGGVRFLASDKI